MPPPLRPMALRLFHGTDREFEIPRPLTHLGTQEAALAAPSFRGVLMAFRLLVDRPLAVPDTAGGGDAWYWLRWAVDRGLLEGIEFERWERRPTDEAAARLLLSTGHDTLVYRNLYEDAGSLSWVVLNPARATRLPHENLPVLGPRR